MNQSCGLSYDETLFLGCQKVPKVKIACNLIKISSNNIFSDIFGHNIFSCYPERAFFHFSLYELTNDKKNVLCKSLNFSVTPGFIG